MRTATACVCGRWHQISGLAVNGHTARGHRRLSRRSTAALLAVVVDARMEIAARSMIANLFEQSWNLSQQSGAGPPQKEGEAAISHRRPIAIYRGHKRCCDVRFSYRPFGVKRFQTIHQFSVDAARGLVLLFGIGSKALPSWELKTRWNNLWGGLAVRRTVGPSGHPISPHPSCREGHHSTARWNSSFLLSHLIPRRSHAAATSRVQRNSVPSTHMRRMITANRRANVHSAGTKV